MHTVTFLKNDSFCADFLYLTLGDGPFFVPSSHFSHRQEGSVYLRNKAKNTLDRRVSYQGMK